MLLMDIVLSAVDSWGLHRGGTDTPVCWPLLLHNTHGTLHILLIVLLHHLCAGCRSQLYIRLPT